MCASVCVRACVRGWASQKLQLAKRGGVLRAFLNQGRVAIADETQAFSGSVHFDVFEGCG
jgi:hypothetical protein